MNILRAVRDALIFMAFVAVLLSAPAWAKWFDEETDAWERAVAEAHARMYERLRAQK